MSGKSQTETRSVHVIVLDCLKNIAQGTCEHKIVLHGHLN